VVTSSDVVFYCGCSRFVEAALLPVRSTGNRAFHELLLPMRAS
jgi:hypothetical protein